MDPISDEARLQYPFVDRVQRRYEVIRPIVLMGERTAAQRAQETQLHPETVRDLGVCTVCVQKVSPVLLCQRYERYLAITDHIAEKSGRFCRRYISDSCRFFQSISL